MNHLLTDRWSFLLRNFSVHKKKTKSTTEKTGGIQVFERTELFEIVKQDERIDFTGIPGYYVLSKWTTINSTNKIKKKFFVKYE